MFTTATGIARNIHSQIADRIGLSIIRGEIPPGELLPSEVRICEMFAVSRPVVREAIRILVGKGLIESRAKSGTRVKIPETWNHLDPDVLRWSLATTNTAGYLRKLFSLRNAVEPTAAAIAAVAATAEDRKVIARALDAMESATSDDAFVNADIAFHKAITMATHNELFWPIAQMFEIALRHSFMLSAPGNHRMRAVAQHRRVMEAICAGDSVAAKAATIALLEHSAEDLDVIQAAAL